MDVGARPTACRDLEQMGLWDTNGCCEICHSAERLVGVPAGPTPCAAVLGTRSSPVLLRGKKAIGAGLRPLAALSVPRPASSR